MPGQARVELGFSTTAAHGLSDALLFLINCFFDLPEVSASRILALSALRDAPAAEPWPRTTIDAAIRQDLSRLVRLQLQNGGWSVWAARFDADPFISVHVAHALQRARAIGLSVPERTLADALAWLRRLDEFAPGDARSRLQPESFRVDFPHQARRAVQAYALYVRRRLGDDVSASASAMLSDAGASALPADALAWLLPAWGSNPDHAAD
ncbi:MAG: hypothetical protein L0271_00425, partial [Gemmatimonadetes bacterium]|nr:hypothetical protein [Gemmatimonadota bacterium]